VEVGEARVALQAEAVDDLGTVDSILSAEEDSIEEAGR